MTPREKLKAFLARKKQEEREENKNKIERSIEKEIEYKETIQILNNRYKANFAY